MSLSDAALAGLRAAVAWNPFGAEVFLRILRDMPWGVRRKDDGPYGLLATMLHAVPRRTWRAPGVGVLATVAAGATDGEERATRGRRQGREHCEDKHRNAYRCGLPLDEHRLMV